MGPGTVNTNYVKDCDIIFQYDDRTKWLWHPMKLKVGIIPVIDDLEITCQTIWNFDVGSQVNEAWEIQ